MQENSKPLVSIIIITYNSSKFVIETLESCNQQSYQNLELIISDDGSTDDTVIVCKNWLEENNSRFIHTKLITTTANTGISANCNRGLQVSKGEWIKIIAGDDILISDCIKENFNFVIRRPEALVIHSKRLDYQENFQEKNFLEEYTLENHYFGSDFISPLNQYKILLRQVLVSAPTVFIKKSLLEEVNGFDESIPMIEDWPLWLKITSAGYKIHYLNKATVKYRLHHESASFMNNKALLIPKTELQKEAVYKKYIYPNIPVLEKLLYEYNFTRMKLFITLDINRGTKALRILNRVIAYPVTKYRLSKVKRLSKDHPL